MKGIDRPEVALNRILVAREGISSELWTEIKSLRAGADDMEKRFDEIVAIRATDSYSKSLGLDRTGVEGEKETLREEIDSLRSCANNDENNFEEIVRARVILKYGGLPK